MTISEERTLPLIDSDYGLSKKPCFWRNSQIPSKGPSPKKSMVIFMRIGLTSGGVCFGIEQRNSAFHLACQTA